MVEDWKKLESREAGNYGVFRIRQDTSRSPRTGQSHAFYVLEAPDWINIIPITPEGQVVLIYQYRHGTEEVTLEIPGGIVDSHDRSLEASARHELLEETGYEAALVMPIGSVTPNPAILNNRCSTFVALGARPAGPQQLESSEDIRVEVVNLEAIPALIASGRITHALVIAAWYLFEQYRKQHPDILSSET